MKNNCNTAYYDFLSNPSLSTFIFQPITDETIINIIDKLKSKNSQSHDGLSSKLLKLVKHETSKAITLIVNQSLNTGIFPDKLKYATKVIPIYKKGDNTKLDNYRPISILPSLNFFRKGNLRPVIRPLPSKQPIVLKSIIMVLRKNTQQN